MDNKMTKQIYSGIIFVITLAYAYISLYPLVWVVIQSFKTETEFLSSIWSLPKSLSFNNYSTAFTEGNLLLYFKNTTVNTVLTVCVYLVFITLAGFAFSKLKMKYKKFFLLYDTD